MERKNTVLLTVIAVATLLVAVVGATFAYFTASSGITGNGGTGTTNVNTAADMENSKITIAQEQSSSSNEVYPGTMNYAKSGLTATVTGDATYKVSYTVSVDIATKDDQGSTDSQFKFPIKWRLYELDTKISQDNQIITCQNVTATPGTEGKETELHYSQVCNENAALIDSSVGKNLIASGILQEQSGCEASESTAENRVSCGSSATYSTTKEFTSVTSSQAVDKYYYLVVEYDKQEEDQNADLKKKIQASVDVAITSTEIVPSA